MKTDVTVVAAPINAVSRRSCPCAALHILVQQCIWGWPCDLLSPSECRRNDTVPVLDLSLKKGYQLSLLCVICKKSSYLAGERTWRGPMGRATPWVYTERPSYPGWDQPASHCLANVLAWTSAIVDSLTRLSLQMMADAAAFTWSRETAQMCLPSRSTESEREHAILSH